MYEKEGRYINFAKNQLSIFSLTDIVDTSERLPSL